MTVMLVVIDPIGRRETPGRRFSKERGSGEFSVAVEHSARLAGGKQQQPERAALSGSDVARATFAPCLRQRWSHAVSAPARGLAWLYRCLPTSH